MTTIFQLLNNKVEIFFFLSLSLLATQHTPAAGQSLGARTLPWLIKGGKNPQTPIFPRGDHGA